MPFSPARCIYPPNHTTASGKRHKNCGGYSPKRTPYYTATGNKCCKLDKGPFPEVGPKCGSIEIRGRGTLPVFEGPLGGVYYLSPTK